MRPRTPLRAPAHESHAAWGSARAGGGAGLIVKMVQRVQSWAKGCFQAASILKTPHASRKKVKRLMYKCFSRRWIKRPRARAL